MESIAKIQRRIEEVKLEKEEEEREKALVGKAESHPDLDDDEDKPRPNPQLEAGKPLPKKFGEFPKELYGKPIEEIDEFYSDKSVRTISSTLILSPASDFFPTFVVY